MGAFLVLGSIPGSIPGSILESVTGPVLGRVPAGSFLRSVPVGRINQRTFNFFSKSEHF